MPPPPPGTSLMSAVCWTPGSAAVRARSCSKNWVCASALIPRTGQRRTRRHDLICVANTYIAAHQVAEAHDEETR